MHQRHDMAIGYDCAILQVVQTNAKPLKLAMETQKAKWVLASI